MSAKSSFFKRCSFQDLFYYLKDFFTKSFLLLGFWTWLVPCLIHSMGYLVSLSWGDNYKNFYCSDINPPHWKYILNVNVVVHLPCEYAGVVLVCAMLPNIKIWIKKEMEISKSVTWLSVAATRPGRFLSSWRYLNLLIIRMIQD